VNLTSSPFTDWYVIPGAAVPEPGALILLALGVASFGLWRLLRGR
jgi:hypothetical protein